MLPPQVARLAQSLVGIEIHEPQALGHLACYLYIPQIVLKTKELGDKHKQIS